VKFAWLPIGLGVRTSTYEHTRDRLDCLGGLPIATEPMYILPMILQLGFSDLRFLIRKARIMCNSKCLRPSWSDVTDLFHIGARYEISLSLS
jgi:hypothetical protein